MRRHRHAAALAALLLGAGCASKPAPPVAPKPPPAIVPPPVTVEPPPEAPADWHDLPLTAGEWAYGAGPAGPEARFSGAGTAFVLRCDLAGRRVALVLEGADAAGAMTVRTTAEARSFGSGSAAVAAEDPLLDAIAFSRGRFLVERAGAAPLVLPAWPEPARTVEDCRGG